MGRDLRHRFLRLFFDLLYGRLAWAYDAVACIVSMGLWVRWVETALAVLGGPSVLELGHGPGHLQVRMARRGWLVAGIDPSPEMGGLARRRLRGAGLPVRLVRARAQALPFCDGSFQEVVATFPTEYVLDPRTCDEAIRVLRPGGRVVIVAAAHFAARDPVSRLLEWLYRVTGQREPLPVVEQGPWRQRLDWEVHWVPVRQSRVLLFRGRRPASGTPLPHDFDKRNRSP